MSGRPESAAQAKETNVRRAQKIQPCLWFDFNAEEAVAFYMSIFPGSSIRSVSHYPESMPGLAGKVLLIEFEIGGQRLQALNAGPQRPFTEAISLSIDCDGQAEVDVLWEKLGSGGSESECGWLKDKFGLSWQVVPHGMGELLSDPDPARASRAMQAMLGMRKLDIDAIRCAADG